MQYRIVSDYYIDVDSQNQIRITGPENHLLLGMGVEKGRQINLTHIEEKEGQLEVKLTIPASKVIFSLPLVCDIRSLRSVVETTSPRPDYFTLAASDYKDLLPTKIEEIASKTDRILAFTREYVQEDSEVFYYGCQLIVPKKYQFQIDEATITLSGEEPIEFTLKTMTNITLKDRYSGPMLSLAYRYDVNRLPEVIKGIYAETEFHLEHLIRARKTSSFEYGTVFPRDWLETAFLGRFDLDKKTIDYMIMQAMAHVTDAGEGWHEDLVGEYRAKQKAGEIVDRKMIDIEPLYILAIDLMSKELFATKWMQKILKAVASYIVDKATETDLITFKKSKSGEYLPIGNWRDSLKAFPGRIDPLAPYDVNCVFYPEALRTILRYQEYLEIKDIDMLRETIERWEKNKTRFRLYHPNDLIGYALALHGRKQLPLPISHLDESYDLYFGAPSKEEVYSFAVKLIDPEYSYTPKGPVLVANDTMGLDTTDYHGKVIWPKQAAFAMAGLGKHLRRARREGWPPSIVKQIIQSIKVTAEACFSGWTDLRAVPELYYYDETKKQARFYTDQSDIEGQMSLIQLWSAAGARRIIHEYLFLN